MKNKIIFIVVTIIVILLIILISMFLNKQNEKMLGIDESNNYKTNTVVATDNNMIVENALVESNHVNNNLENNNAGSNTVENNNDDAGIIEVTEKDFNNEVLNSDKPVLIDFYADWCEPCKILYPIIEEIAEENENIKVVRINVDNEFDLSMQYQVMSIPTMVVIKNGEEVNRIIGVNTKENILSILEETYKTSCKNTLKIIQ